MSNEFYHNKLLEYFDKNYDDECGFYPNPAPNIWKFYNPWIGADIYLTCMDDGVITEQIINKK
jgi:hypothetical protein